MEIELPDGTVLDAPDDADPSVVAKAYLAKQAKPAPAAAQVQAEPQGAKLGDWASAAIRPPIKAVTGLAGIFADGTMAAWNLASGQNNQMPSEATSNLLDKYTTAPTGVGKAAEFVSTAVLGSRIPGLPKAPTKPPPKMTPKQEAFIRGRDAGYVAPPSSVAPTAGRQFVESLGGKAATQQVASVKNQAVTNKLIAQDLGLPEGEAISREALAKVRATAGKVYGDIQRTGVIAADPEYADELRSILKPAEELADDFPDLNLGNNEQVATLVKSLSRDKFSAKGALEASKQLRKAATGNLGGINATDPAKRAMGYAQRNAADAIESLVDRHLRANGRADLADAFDSARTTIAKAHAAESALNPATGNIAARELAKNFRKGKPMSGGFRQAGEFATTFPKATAEILDSGPVSALDAAVAGGASTLGAALGGASFAPLGLAWPALRIGSRYGMLTPGFQNALIPVNGSVQPLNALYGAAAGVNSLPR